MSILILAAAARADDECKFDNLFYEIKLLDVAAKRGFAIDSQARNAFLFGPCEDHALLELENDELIVFSLEGETGIPIRLVGRASEELELLRERLKTRSFWDKLIDKAGQIEIRNDVDIKAIWHLDVPNVLFYYPFENRGEFILGDHREQIAKFVSARVNEDRYLKKLIEVLYELRDLSPSVTVAGDNGFIISDAGENEFFEYPSGKRVPICSFKEILDRAGKFPEGVSVDSFSEEPAAYQRVLVELANHTHRSRFTTLGFGCTQ